MATIAAAVRALDGVARRGRTTTLVLWFTVPPQARARPGVGCDSSYSKLITAT
jgi:hypothetical protein